jgi:phage baseplate assembly protein W
MTRTHVDFPFTLDPGGSTARADDAGYVRDLVEMVLFTSQGERVNRPDFGGGVRALPFALNGPELEAALTYTLESNLQRWLGALIEVRTLRVTSAHERLTIELRYAVRRTGEERSETITRDV